MSDQIDNSTDGAMTDMPDQSGRKEAGERPVRADARRNLDGLLQAAMEVFSVSGVDAPVREIAKKAGVGVGTLYRHFPQRSDLIKAVLRREIDACADAAPALSAAHPPAVALSLFMQRFADFILAKRGLAAALHSGDPAYAALPAYFDQKLLPVFESLLDAAIEGGEVRADIAALDLLHATARLATTSADGDGQAQARRMVGLLADGLKVGR